MNIKLGKWTLASRRRKRTAKYAEAAMTSVNADKRRELLVGEWGECRKSIERFDHNIVDLRKYGFTLTTLLITAEAYFFTSGNAMTLQSKAAASFVILVLIFALYIIDRCHENFLRGAVDRVETVEDMLGMKLSKSISDFSKRAETDTHGVKLYSWFIIAGSLPFLASADFACLDSIRLVVAFLGGTAFFMVSIWERYGIARKKADNNGILAEGKLKILYWFKMLAILAIIPLFTDNCAAVLATGGFVVVYAIISAVLIIKINLLNKNH